jgi:hypothetical protein
MGETLQGAAAALVMREQFPDDYLRQFLITASVMLLIAALEAMALILHWI